VYQHGCFYPNLKNPVSNHHLLWVLFQRIEKLMGGTADNSCLNFLSKFYTICYSVWFLCLALHWRISGIFPFFIGFGNLAHLSSILWYWDVLQVPRILSGSSKSDPGSWLFPTAWVVCRDKIVWYYLYWWDLDLLLLQTHFCLDWKCSTCQGSTIVREHEDFEIILLLKFNWGPIIIFLWNGLLSV